MKRFLSLLLCLLMIFALCACGEKSPTGSDSPDNAPAVTDAGGENGTAEILVEFGEPAIYQWVQLGDEAKPCFEIVVPVKNVSDGYVCLRGCTYTLTDKDGNEVATFSGADCAPYYIAPDQEGIIYYSEINRSGLDYTSPDYTLSSTAEFAAVTWEFVELEVSDDIALNKNLGCTEMRGTLINSTDYEFEFPAITFLFYDKEGNILCGGYTAGGSNDSGSEDFGMLHANSSCDFYTCRYWLPNDYPLEDVTVKAFAFGTPIA